VSVKIPAKRGVILDFDGTCISREQVALIYVVDRNAMPDEAREDLNTVWNIYGEKAINGLMSPLEEEAWMVQTVEMYARYRMRLIDIYRSLDSVRLKPCFKQFLREMKKRGIPVAICSYSIRQFIWYVLYKEGVHHLVDDIFATDVVTWDATETAEPISRLDFDSVVTPSNKGRWSETFARKFGVPNRKILAVGDSSGDRNLGCLKENRLCLVEDEVEIERFGLDRHFGHITASKSFSPVLDWMLNVKKIDEEE